MRSIKSLLISLAKGEEGVTMIEYALLAALIAMAAIAMVSQVGTAVNNKYSTISNSVSNAGN